MDQKTLVYLLTIIISSVGFYFSMRFTMRAVKSGEITSHKKIGGTLKGRQVHRRTEDPVNYWTFLVIYSLLWNAPLLFLFLTSLNGLYIGSQL